MMILSGGPSSGGHSYNPHNAPHQVGLSGPGKPPLPAVLPPAILPQTQGGCPMQNVQNASFQQNHPNGGGQGMLNQSGGIGSGITGITSQIHPDNAAQIITQAQIQSAAGMQGAHLQTDITSMQNMIPNDTMQTQQMTTNQMLGMVGNDLQIQNSMLNQMPSAMGGNTNQMLNMPNGMQQMPHQMGPPNGLSSGMLPDMQIQGGMGPQPGMMMGTMSLAPGALGTIPGTIPLNSQPSVTVGYSLTFIRD